MFFVNKIHKMAFISVIVRGGGYTKRVMVLKYISVPIGVYSDNFRF